MFPDSHVYVVGGVNLFCRTQPRGCSCALCLRAGRWQMTQCSYCHALVTPVEPADTEEQIVSVFAVCFRCVLQNIFIRQVHQPGSDIQDRNSLKTSERSCTKVLQINGRRPDRSKCAVKQITCLLTRHSQSVVHRFQNQPSTPNVLLVRSR